MQSDAWGLKDEEKQKKPAQLQSLERFQDRKRQEHREWKWEGVLKAKGLNTKQLSPDRENGREPVTHHPANSARQKNWEEL